MIELGGNIKLDGFETLPKEKLIVIKKIIGGFTKEVSEKDSDFKEIIVKIQDSYKITIEIKGTKETKSEVKDSNLFFAMSLAIKDAKSKYL
tara:strand:+ start:953 stop:1225 length:273 start_codon:yes stop_codon:yes gene_type:complete